MKYFAKCFFVFARRGIEWGNVSEFFIGWMVFDCEPTQWHIQTRYRCFSRHHHQQFHAAQHFLSVPIAVAARAHTHAPHTNKHTENFFPNDFYRFLLLFRSLFASIFSWFVLQKTHSHKTVPNAFPVFFSLSVSLFRFLIFVRCATTFTIEIFIF